MKAELFLALVLSGLSLAQNAVLSLPKQEASITRGDDLVVQVQRPNTITGSQEVAVVIGLQQCPESECYPSKDYMGQILYNGPFTPQYHETGLPPYENFTVSVPGDAQKGKAVVGVAHVTLVGASAWPLLEVFEAAVSLD